MAIFLPYLSEKTKQYLTELEKVGKKISISRTFYELKNTTASYQILPYQNITGMWGVLYNESGWGTFCYYSASSDPTAERDHLNKDKQPWGGATVWSDANSYGQSPKINANNSIDFSEAYANYTISKLIELQYNWNVLKKEGTSWDNFNNAKPTKADIDNYINGEYKELKINNDSELLNKYRKWFGELSDQWTTDQLRAYFNDTPIHPDGIKKVKPALDNLKTWTDTFKNLKPAEVKTEYDKPKDQHTPEQLEKHTDADLKPADYDDIKKEKTQLSQYWNEIISKDYADNKPLADDGLKALHLKLVDNKTKLKLKDIEIEKLKKGGSQALSKLLTIYTAQIKQETETFYQDLSLDNNWINEKYGDKNINYLDRLKDLKAESEPEQVINAFKVIALIVATDKAQETSDKYKDRLAKLPANLKKNNLNDFKKLKEVWDLLTDEIKEDNNPLYLPIIKQKGDYIAKINNIITLWQ